MSSNNHLTIGGCDAVALAKTYGTPLYVYDESYLRAQCRAFVSALHAADTNGQVAYATKAFLTSALLKILESEGVDVDVCSEGELFVAQSAVFPPERITYHGSNKSKREINAAIAYGVGRIVVDHIDEIDMISECARKHNAVAQVLIRVNPGIDAHIHEYVQTARVDSKFGLGMEDGGAMQAVQRACQAAHVKFMGIHAHIGSQILSLQPYYDTIIHIANFCAQIAQPAPEIVLGGGYGVKYLPEDVPLAPDLAVKAMADTLFSAFAARGLIRPRMCIEPGRAICAEACTMLYTIGAVKELPGIRRYASIDGGLADNPRPALYDSKYSLTLANRLSDPVVDVTTISGRSCESDTMFEDAAIPIPRRGDILAVFSAGAYQHSMAGNYNKTPIPAVVLVNNGHSALMQKRQALEDLTRNDVFPEWLN